MEQEFHGLYIQPEAWHADIPNSAKILHGRLCNLPSFSMDGSHASRDWMAKEIGVSKQRITQLIKALIDSGLIIDNGWYTNSNGNRTRLLKRGILTVPNKKLLDPPNKKLLDPPNKKLLPNNKSINNKKESMLGDRSPNTPTTDFPKNRNWLGTEFSDKFDFLYSLGNGTKIPIEQLKKCYSSEIVFYRNIPEQLRPKYLRFALNIQEQIHFNRPAYFQTYSTEQHIKQAIASVCEIYRLVKNRHFDFSACIKPCIKWGIKEKFWGNNILSLANIQHTGKNGLPKFDNLYNDWCQKEGIDPKLGRLGKKSDFIDHGYFGSKI